MVTGRRKSAAPVGNFISEGPDLKHFDNGQLSVDNTEDEDLSRCGVDSGLTTYHRPRFLCCSQHDLVVRRNCVNCVPGIPTFKGGPLTPGAED